MPAPDIKTLYKFESNVEPAVKAALIAAGLPDGNVTIALGSTTLATPSTEVTLRLGANNGHKFPPPTLSYWVFDQWGCVVNVVIRTNRGSNAASHEDYRATLRMVLPDVFARINAALTYHAFAEPFREQGTSISVDAENDHDISELSFSSVLAIKRDAWPTV
jgi:hypothetical protein